MHMSGQPYVLHSQILLIGFSAGTPPAEMMAETELSSSRKARGISGHDHVSTHDLHLLLSILI
jgi:hypothetical protein